MNREEEIKKDKLNLEEDEFCDYCGIAINISKDKFWVKKNITSQAEAITKGVLCENCINSGLDTIDEIEFNISDGNDEERKRIFNEVFIAKKNKIYQKTKIKMLKDEIKFLEMLRDRIYNRGV